MAAMQERQAESIYQEHVKVVYRFCLWRLNSHHDAEDVATDVFVKVLDGKANGIPPENLNAWLLKVAENECMTFFRKRKRKHEVCLEEGHHVAHVDYKPWFSANVCLAINQFRPAAKKVVFLKAVEQMTFKEIAAFLEISEGAAKTIFYRTIKKLATVIEEKCDYEDV